MARAKKEAVLTPKERLQAALVPDWEWPYKLPENWCWTRLGSVSTIVGGGTPSSGVAEYYENGTIPWISPADLSGYSDMYISHGAKNITELGLEKSSARLMPAGTVCLSSRAPIGYVVIAQNDISTNQGFKSMLPSPCFISEYLYWYLKGNKELLESYASGTTFLEISGGKTAQVEFPLAPLAEQQRIVDRIESLFAKLDEAKEKAQAVVDNCETRKAAILHQAFSGKLTANWRVEHGISMDSWKCVKFSDVLDVRDGTHDSPTYHDMGYPLITSKNLKDGQITDKDIRYISKEDYEKINERSKVDIGDILFAMIGTIGNPVVVQNEPQFAIKNMALFKNIGRINPYFVKYYLESKTVNDKMQKDAKGSTQKFVSLGYLRAFLIDVPLELEQMEIVHILDNLLAEEQQAKETAEAVLEQIDLMKKSILARAFRGELGTNDPSEESAVELLKKVSHMPAETKSKAKRKFVPQKIEAQIKTDLERKIIMAFIQNDTVIMPIQQLMSVSSRKFDVIETLRNLQERGILLKENDTYKLMG